MSRPPSHRSAFHAYHHHPLSRGSYTVLPTHDTGSPAVSPLRSTHHLVSRLPRRALLFLIAVTSLIYLYSGEALDYIIPSDYARANAEVAWSIPDHAQNWVQPHPTDPLWSTYTLPASSSPESWQVDPTTTPLPSTVAQTLLSTTCADLWISQAVVCDALRGGRMAKAGGRAYIDVISSWVNGTDDRSTLWRTTLANDGVHPSLDAEAHAERVGKAQGYGTRANHFRTHDELVHSWRSFYHNLPLEAVRRIVLLTPDLPSLELLERARGGRSGQVPNWLDLQGVIRPRPGSGNGSLDAPPITLRHDAMLFKFPRVLGTDEEAIAWRDKALPSYNSNAIEAMLGNLDALAETFFYACDDMFLLRPMTLADLATPLLGPIFRVYRSVPVEGQAPQPLARISDPEGEWGTLRIAGYLLDERFGARPRSYVAHIAKTLSGTALREISQVWAEDLALAAQVRFRGRGHSINMNFLNTHYLLEKHREALLWSFLIARFDADRSGTFDAAERAELVEQLRSAGYEPEVGQSAETIQIVRPVRTDVGTVLEALDAAGFDRPKGTKYSFTSANGYPHIELPGRGKAQWPNYDAKESGEDVACEIRIARCLGPEFLADDATAMVDADALFKRVAFEKHDCGDCIIVAGLGLSGPSGLRAFLPLNDPDKAVNSKPNHARAPTIGLGGVTWEEADFSWTGVERQLNTDAFESLRDFCVRLIHRYSFVLGDSPGRFVMIKDMKDLVSRFETIQEIFAPANVARLNDRTPAFLGINDDVVEDQYLEPVDTAMKSFMSQMWPLPAPWERRLVL